MAYSEIEKAAMCRDLAAYVGMAIKLRRVELGLTQQDLSELTGITRAAICNIEQGGTDIRLSSIALLRSALALDITIAPLGNAKKMTRRPKKVRQPPQTA